MSDYSNLSRAAAEIGRMAELANPVGHVLWEIQRSSQHQATQLQKTFDSLRRPWSATREMALQLGRTASQAHLDIARSVGAAASATRQLEAIGAAQARELAELKRYFQPGAHASRAIADLIGSAARSADLGSVIRGLQLPSSHASSIVAFAKRFDEEWAEDRIASIQALLDREVSEDESDIVSVQRDDPVFVHSTRENVLLFLFTLLLFYYPIWLGERSDLELESRLSRMEQQSASQSQKQDQIYDLLRALVETEPPRTGREFVVLGRPVTIVSERMGTDLVAVAYPNQILECMEERGPWIKVSYHDWVSNEEVEGWARKKYMRRVLAAESR